MDINGSAGERGYPFGLAIMIDMAVRDENPLNGIETEANGFQPLLQCVKRSLCLDPCIDQGPRRLIDEKNIHGLEGKRNGKFNFIYLVQHPGGHDPVPLPWPDLIESRYHRIRVFQNN